VLVHILAHIHNGILGNPLGSTGGLAYIGLGTGCLSSNTILDLIGASRHPIYSFVRRFSDLVCGSRF
jgi:hypothetical protein